MRILFIIEGITADAGGPSLEVARMGERVIAEGSEVEILVPFSQGQEVTFAPEIKITRINARRNNVAVLTMAVIDALDRSDILIVFGIWGTIVGPVIAAARPWARIPTFFKTLGMLEPYILARKSRIKKIALRAYVSANLTNADGVLVNSAAESCNVRSVASRARIKILPNGVSFSEIPEKSRQAARKDLSIEGDQFLILFLGRLHPKKRPMYVLEAAHPLLNRYPNVRVIIAGPTSDESYAKSLIEFVEKNGLTSQVSFPGSLFGPDKWNALIGADLFVLPSQSEGFSNAVLEALAVGCPVVITQECNFPEVGFVGAGKVISSTMNDLRKALSEYLENPVELRSASTAARELCRSKYDWVSLTKTHLALFSSTLSAGDICL